MASTDKLIRIILKLQDDFSKQLDAPTNMTTRFGDGLQKAGKIMSATVTPALVAMGGAAIKAAMDWETAFTGVLKTVDGTDEQLAALEESLRNLATQGNLSALENAHIEIAGIAEAAGQLGVGVNDIEEFTSVVGELSMATNIAGEEGAAMIAQFANVADMPLSDIRQFGDVISTLGNNSATTENDILSMGQRLAQISQVGFNPDEILAYSSALSSMGISAELGGTNFAMGVNKIAVAVAEGGESLENIADVAGVSMEQFRRAFEDDASGAIQSFIEGLSDMPVEEQVAALESLGLSGQEAQRVFRTLAGNTALLTDQLNLANEAYAGNGALAEEAAKRAQTAEGNFNTLKNVLMELRVTFGEILLPFFNAFVQKLTEAVRWFGNLPEPVKKLIVVIGGIVAALGPVLVVVGSIISAIGTIGGALGGLSTIAAALVPAITAIVSGFTALVPAVMAFLAPLLPLIAAIGALGLALHFWERNNTTEVWRNNFAMLGTITEEGTRRIGNTLNESGKTWGQNFQNFGKILDLVKQKFLKFAAQAIPQLIQAFSGVLSAMQAVGGNVIQGLIEGVRSKISDFINMVRDVAQRAVDAVQDAFGIHSPSRVMAGMGANVVAGFEQGIAGAGGLQIPTPTATSGRIPATSNGGVLGGGRGGVYIENMNLPAGTTQEMAEEVSRLIAKEANSYGSIGIR